MDMKVIREEKGLTQIDMAIAVGVSLSSYRMWEKGVTKPNEVNGHKLKQILGGE